MTQSASLLQRAHFKVLVSDVPEPLSDSHSPAVQVGLHEEESPRVLGGQPNAAQVITQNSNTTAIDALAALPSTSPQSRRNRTMPLLLIAALVIILTGIVLVWRRCVSNHAEQATAISRSRRAMSRSFSSTMELFRSLPIGPTESHGLREREFYEEDAVLKFIQKNYRPTKLLLRVIAALARFWSMLAVMYWALTHRSTALMECNKADLSLLSRYACKYTLACLHAYPILCANFTLVLMVRVLVQMQIYYAMLKQCVVVDFVTLRIMNTPWPWICLIQMMQGGLHFVLKTYLESGLLDFESMQTCVAAASKFVIPGIMFMSFFESYTDIDNVLVPLNRIVEQEYTRENRECPWLSKIKVVNERVLSKDVRNNDVYARTREEIGKDYLTIKDVTQNIIEHYEEVHEEWLAKRESRAAEERRQKWIFRSLWPAAVLTHRQMDRNDPDTWEWLCVITSLVLGSAIVSATSLCVLIMKCSPSVTFWGAPLWRHLLTDGLRALPLDDALTNMVFISHAMMVLFFLYRSMWGMFYQQLQKKSPDNLIMVLMGVTLLFIGFATTRFVG